MSDCPICGYDWEAHEFAVPAPYCPENDEDARRNRESSKRIKEWMNQAKLGKAPFKRKP
jgi:hypothetical protein